MGLPSINITFITAALAAIARSEKGIVALIVRDSKETGAHELATAAEVPGKLCAVNQAYIKRAFLGYVNPPRRVLLYVLPPAGELAVALAYFATQVFDYLAGPPDITEAECAEVVSWIKARRLNDKAICKAVLPSTVADSEAVINFTTGDIAVGSVKHSAAEYCSRIAGLIAGTPMTISCTYAPLHEVTDVARMSTEVMDAAIDAGQFILLHDGVKVKVGRGVTSFVSVNEDKGDAYRKIKLVEAMDMMQSDIRMTAQDRFIGKYSASYDNKVLLITAITGYFEELERGGILARGMSSCEIDVAANEAYLRAAGADTSAMSEQQIKEAATGDQVFLTATARILDAIEDIALKIAV